MSWRLMAGASALLALLIISRTVESTRIVILPESRSAAQTGAFAEVMETFEEAPIDPLTPPRRWEGSGDDDDGLASQVPKYLVGNTTFNDASAPTDTDPIPPCASSSCLPPPKGLVGFWPGDGNGDDVVGYSGDPSFASFTGPGATYETGKVGPAFEFYSHKSLNLGNAPELQVGGLGAGMTVEFWIQFRRLDTDIPIIEKSITDHGVGTPIEEPNPIAAAGLVPKSFKVGNTNTDGWRVFYNKDDQMIWFCMGHHIGGCPVDGDDRAAPLVRTRQTQLATNVWYHVAAVKTTGDLYLYLNGKVEDHKEIDDLSLVNTNKATSLLIGASAAPYPKPPPYLDGFMDEVSLYSRALSSEEISAILGKAGAGKCKCLAPLVPKLAAWWPADGHAGDLVAVNIGREYGKDFSHNSGPTASFSSFSSPRDGKVKQAFHFDGNLAMTLGNAPQVHIGGAGAEFSVNLWVRFSALPDSQHAPDVPILEKMAAVSPLASDGWRIYRHGRTRAIGFCIGTTITQKEFDSLPKNFVRNAFFPVCDPANSRNNTIFTTSNIETDAWYHVAVVRTLSDISIYLNGALQESKAIAASSVLDTNQAELLAGTHSMVDSSIALAQGDNLLLDRRRRAIRPHYLHGFLDEIQLHRRPLSRLDVRLAYEADSRGQCKEVRCKKGYIRLYYNLPEARAVYATIHNRSGVVVRRIPKIAGKLGLNYLLWDGKDDLGKKVDRKDRPYVARVWQKETQRLVDTVRIPLKTRKYTCADQ